MIDYEELARGIRAMNPRLKLYKVLKAELSKMGHWRDKPRGAAFKKGTDPRRVKLVRDPAPLTGQEAVAAARMLRYRRKSIDKQG